MTKFIKRKEFDLRETKKISLFRSWEKNMIYKTKRNFHFGGVLSTLFDT